MATDEKQQQQAPPPSRANRRTLIYIRMDWVLRTFCLMVINFLTSSEFYVPTFHFKPAFPDFSLQPTEGVDESDADADVTDADVVTATDKLAATVVSDDEQEVTSDSEVFTSDDSQDGMSVLKEVSTLTDVCYNENLAEVDLVSLIEEQLPRYVLRADTITDFAGYDNADWIQTPVLPPDVDLDLSPIVIEETLKYFILCAERVGQMTKTYNDIEAVTRLLEEKERDLELAARIGQNLLDKNKELEEKNEQLEEQLAHANDCVAQLRHEVSMKDALLQAYIQDYDSETPGESPTKALLGLGHVDNLQKKVRGLEEENLTLRCETAQLKVETCDLEEKEERLVKDAVRQLADVNGRIQALQDELFTKAELTLRQHDEITALLNKVVSLEATIKKLTVENAELTSHLTAAQESQRELTTEISEQHDKYHELLALHAEAQEQLKALRSKHGPNAVRQQYGHYMPFLPEGSLAFELEDSIKKDMDYPEGYSPADRRSHNKRVMETAKTVKRHNNRKSSSLMSIPGSSHSTSGNETCESIAGSSNRSSLYLSESESFNDGYSGDVDSNYGSATTLGRPGIPGSNDLETALRRLTLRKANEINESILRDVDDKKKSGGSSTPTGYQTPDSLMSMGSGSNFSDLSRFSGISGYGFRIPEKLQIVKPMEGSMTLHHWQRLATPHLGGFLDPRPGIQIKGEKPIEVDQEVYTLSDYEEDGEADYVNPGKSDVWSQSTYTYTTAKIMHPTDQYDGTNLSSVYGGAPRPSVCATEAPPSRNAANCTTTFSMNMGLAQLLHERGILAQSSPSSLAACKGDQQHKQQSTPPKVKVNGTLLLGAQRPTRVRHTPQRFNSIVTETLSDSNRSHTEVIYTCAATTPSAAGGLSASHPAAGSPATSLPGLPTNIPPFEGISDTAMPLLRPDTYDIVDQVLNQQLDKMASSTAAAVNILGAGLNTILPVNERRGLATRQDAMAAGRRASPTPTDGLSPATSTPASGASGGKAGKTTRPSYLGELPPPGASRSRGVLTRVRAARMAATTTSTTSSTLGLGTTRSLDGLATLSTSAAASRTLAPGPLSSAGGGTTTSAAVACAAASRPSTLTTSTLSSNYYSSPISFSALPEMSRESAAAGAAVDGGRGDATSGQQPAAGGMSPSLIKHLANIRMKRRRQAGLLSVLAADHKPPSLACILSPDPNSPAASSSATPPTQEPRSQKTDVD